jgi:hypothetical protein
MDDEDIESLNYGGGEDDHKYWKDIPCCRESLITGRSDSLQLVACSYDDLLDFGSEVHCHGFR